MILVLVQEDMYGGKMMGKETATNNGEVVKRRSMHAVRASAYGPTSIWGGQTQFCPNGHEQVFCLLPE